MFNRNRILFSLCILALAAVGCGSKADKGIANIQSTDQRPEISEDHSEVYLTVGTKDHARIKASSLQALVSQVPDPYSGATSTKKLTGEFIFQVAQNERTTLAAIAVRGMIYAESDFTMLFIVNPSVPDKPQLVKFVMPGKKPAADGSTPAFRAVRELHYDSSGLLHLVHADASGSKAEVLINPDMTIRSCKYLVRDEGNLCGEDH